MVARAAIAAVATGLVALGAAGAEPAPTGATARTASLDGGQVTLALAFRQSAPLPQALYPFPMHEPGLDLSLGIGLRGPADLLVSAAIGAGYHELQLSWEGSCGLRVAPVAGGRPASFAVAVRGGIRSPMSYPGMGISWEPYDARAPVAVSFARLDGSFEAALPDPHTVSFLLRARYEPQFSIQRVLLYAESTTVTSRPVVSGHLWELLTGWALSPAKRTSPFIEYGAYYYITMHAEMPPSHWGLIIVFGVGIGPRSGDESPATGPPPS